MKLIIALTLATGPAFAQVCPPTTDHSVQQADILAQLQALPNPVGARELSNALWALWTDAPDAHAQALLDEGMRQREGFDLLGARDTLDALVEYCPDYAEGYNQRAFASFLRADYEAALYDLDAALRIMPTHVAALSGKALTLLRMDRNTEAQDVLRQAVDLNPWLSERTLLEEPEGEEI